MSKLNLEESITKRNYLKKPIGETGDQEDAKGQTLKIFHFTPAVQSSIKKIANTHIQQRMISGLKLIEVFTY